MACMVGKLSRGSKPLHSSRTKSPTKNIPKYTSGSSSLKQGSMSNSPENIEILEEVESQYNLVSSSSIDPIDSFISEEINIINPQL